MADQITTVSKLRLANKKGNLSLSDMKKIEQIIKIQLDF
jgi:mRNA-degrading endonuclease toxin of MazEF toxin-antitoxin module